MSKEKHSASIEAMKNVIAPIEVVDHKNQKLANREMVFANAHVTNGYSITEMLDMGVRGIELNVYKENGEFKVCNKVNDVCSIASDVKAKDALREINEWMKKHPNDMVFINVQDSLSVDQKKEFATVLKKSFYHGKIANPSQYDSKNVPSVADMVKKSNARVMILQDNPAYKNIGFDSKSVFKNIVSGNIVKSSGIIESVQKAEEEKAPSMMSRVPFLGGYFSTSKPKEYVINAAAINGLKDAGCRIYGSPKKSTSEMPMFIPSSTASKVYGIEGNAVFDTAKGLVSLVPTITNAAMGALGYNTAAKTIVASTAEGVNAYNSHMESVLKEKGEVTMSDKLKALVNVVAPAAISFGIEGAAASEVAKNLKSSLGNNVSASDAKKIEEAAQQNPTTFLSMGLNLAAQALSGGLGFARGAAATAAQAVPGVRAAQNIVKPKEQDKSKGIVERAESGLVRGIDDSMNAGVVGWITGFIFGKVEFEGNLQRQDDAIGRAAKALDKLVEAHTELQGDVKAQRKAYNAKVDEGRRKYLQENKGVDPYDLVYPSFEEARSRLNEINKDKVVEKPKVSKEELCKVIKEKWETVRKNTPRNKQHNLYNHMIKDMLKDHVIDAPRSEIPSLEEIRKFKGPEKKEAFAEKVKVTTSNHSRSM